MKSDNIVWHDTCITKRDRVKLLSQKPCILWFTGLSGSGKSTIANAVEEKLYELDIKTYLLDGDNVRHGLNKDLGFSEKDRMENIRRVGEVAKLFVDSGIVTIAVFISPFIKDRELVRNLVEEDEFIEIFVDTPLEVCESRDPKGLYQKARKGIVKNFTGIDSPYEKPRFPAIHLRTKELSVDECVTKVIEYLREHEYIEK